MGSAMVLFYLQDNSVKDERIGAIDQIKGALNSEPTLALSHD